MELAEAILLGSYLVFSGITTLVINDGVSMLCMLGVC